MLWIPIIGWIIAPIAFVFAIVAWLMVLGRIRNPPAMRGYTCQHCKRKFDA